MATPPATLTLAALYDKQGLKGKARELYEELKKSDDPRIREEAARRLGALGPSGQDAISLLHELSRRVQERKRRQGEGK
ncbi:MAG: hypothetical protein JST92_25320 [Deltaproteobacteria bacterium]|nr:hypothetical protein [Deltaproteobacteria bacterium]